MPSDAFDYRSLMEAGFLPPTLAERLEELRPRCMRRAGCRGVGVSSFFPDRRAEHAPGLALCASCEVVEECRAFAVADASLAGVWGGTSEPERVSLRRQAA